MAQMFALGLEEKRRETRIDDLVLKETVNRLLLRLSRRTCLKYKKESQPHLAYLSPHPHPRLIIASSCFTAIDHFNESISLPQQTSTNFFLYVL